MSNPAQKNVNLAVVSVHAIAATAAMSFNTGVPHPRCETGVGAFCVQVDTQGGDAIRRP